MAIPFWQIMGHGPGHGTRAAGAAATSGRRPVFTVVGQRENADREQGLLVEFTDFAGAEACRGEWEALLERALEPNIFMEPAFVLSAAQHLAESERPLFAMVREQREDGAGRLVGIWPLASRGVLAGGFVRGWRSPYAVLGSPLIDRFRAGAVADAVLQAVAAKFGPRAMLVAPQVRRTGPTYGLLVSRAMATNRVWEALSPQSRAVLRAGAEADAVFRDAGSLRNLGKLARKRRRLEALGVLEYRSAQTPDEVRAAAERFLLLEESGWKGRSSTALLSHARTATFARTMLRTFARSGQCRIDSLELDGRPLAMAILLQGQRRAYCWKIAFDEAYALYSPGVQMMIELTRRQLADPDVLVTDSCAVAGDPMIERLWTDRQDIVDIAVAAMPGAPAAALAALGRERLRRQAREWAKRTVLAIRSPVRAVRTLRAGGTASISES